MTPRPSATILPYAHRRSALAARIAAAAALLPPDYLELVAKIAESLARPFARPPFDAA